MRSLHCNHRAGAAGGCTINPHRLPANVVPSAYNLRMCPDLKQGRFQGQVAIAVAVAKPTDAIVLNALGLEITSARIVSASGTVLTGKVKLDAASERATISVDGMIGAGAWRLELAFNGSLSDKLKGFYRSTYKDTAGAEQVIATTQFESTDARRAFPCFDEPALKSTFAITLVIDEDLTGISNGRLLSEKLLPGTGKKELVFATTMKMSTYIVAFIVGKLAPTEAVYVDGTELRMWTVPGKEHLARFALEAGAFSLRYLTKYFGIAYPGGDKLDLVAIPDFASGAMENLGCVTFRETVLVDPATADQDSLDWVAEVVAHELAHMWFGNLVTMKWWNGLWLNEAFATFMAAKTAEAFRPTWGVWEKFGLSRGTAMRTDALGSTRPIEFEVLSPSDADGMFDVLTYQKGCSVLRMLEQYLGEKTFRQGIAAYIAKHSYGNTETADLWQALEDASQKPVGDIMDDWIFDSGFPLVSVSANAKDGYINISQGAFKFLPEKIDQHQVWQVPVALKAKTAAGVVEKWVLLAQQDMEVHLGEGIEWVLANAGGHGFYRTNYCQSLSAKLRANLQELSVIERYNLVADTWACVRAGLGMATDFQALCLLFGQETDPNVWSGILAPLAAVHEILPAENRPQFEQAVRGLIQPVLARLGWEAKESESIQTRELRASVIAALGTTGNDTSVQARARELYQAWREDATAVDGNVISAVVNVVAHAGNQDLYNEFLDSFKAATNPNDEQRFLYGLAGFPAQDLLERTLAHTLDPATIRTQDAPFVLARVVANDNITARAWQFIKDNWARIAKLYPESALVRMCHATIVQLDTPELEADAQAFFSANTVKGGDKTIGQALELLRVNVLFRQRETTPLAALFAPPPAPSTKPAEGETTVSPPHAGDGACRPPVPADAGQAQA